MLDFSSTYRDDRLDTLLPNVTAPGIRRWEESRRASMRARHHHTLAERVRRESPVLAALARGQAVEPVKTDAPSVRDALASWDAHVAGARAHFAAQDEAYRLARLLPDHDEHASPSPVWRAMLNDLNDLNTTEV
ncbi:hypothetical protein PCE31106_00123 [Pandoraea cepalis]|uniref:Uncharacterized protein n=1 Tax=Pandoraea cepalis TaxID=2508294 RepID=A0A5E4RHW4_9BURK|nr:hypothetical protein [Pandoraea cepalis]VVD61548.1 hypothetical protein PCE31106_00123 [Pandoraea cepalis]